MPKTMQMATASRIAKECATQNYSFKWANAYYDYLYS